MQNSQQNYFWSPYRETNLQYPSQSSDFIPLHLGGSTQNDYKPTRGGQKNNNFYQKKSPHCFGGPNAAHSGRGWQQNQGSHRQSYRGNNRLKQNLYQQNQQKCYGYHQNQQKGYGYQQNQQKENNGKDTYSLYFHQSMLEDPWHYLEKRQQALKRSFTNTTKDKSENEEEQQDFDYGDQT